MRGGRFSPPPSLLPPPAQGRRSDTAEGSAQRTNAPTAPHKTADQEDSRSRPLPAYRPWPIPSFPPKAFRPLERAPLCLRLPPTMRGLLRAQLGPRPRLRPRLRPPTRRRPAALVLVLAAQLASAGVPPCAAYLSSGGEASGGEKTSTHAAIVLEALAYLGKVMPVDSELRPHLEQLAGHRSLLVRGSNDAEREGGRLSLLGGGDGPERPGALLQPHHPGRATRGAERGALGPDPGVDGVARRGAHPGPGTGPLLRGPLGVVLRQGRPVPASSGRSGGGGQGARLRRPPRRRRHRPPARHRLRGGERGRLPPRPVRAVRGAELRQVRTAPVHLLGAGDCGQGNRHAGPARRQGKPPLRPPHRACLVGPGRAHGHGRGQDGGAGQGAHCGPHPALPLRRRGEEASRGRGSSDHQGEDAGRPQGGRGHSRRPGASRPDGPGGGGERYGAPEYRGYLANTADVQPQQGADAFGWSFVHFAEAEDFALGEVTFNLEMWDVDADYRCRDGCGNLNKPVFIDGSTGAAVNLTLSLTEESEGAVVAGHVTGCDVTATSRGRMRRHCQDRLRHRALVSY